MAIAITLLIVEVRVDQQLGEDLADALGHSGPEMIAYAATFLQIGIMWANHHALFRTVDRVEQLLLLTNLLLLGLIAFLPLPARLVAEHTTGGDARTAMLLYGGTLSGCAVAYYLIWRHVMRRTCSSMASPPSFAESRHPLRRWTERLPRRHACRLRRALAHLGRDGPARAALPARSVPPTSPSRAGRIVLAIRNPEAGSSWPTLTRQGASDRVGAAGRAPIGYSESRHRML